jgi:hypothetical protein
MDIRYPNTFLPEISKADEFNMNLEALPRSTSWDTENAADPITLAEQVRPTWPDFVMSLLAPLLLA